MLQGIHGPADNVSPLKQPLIIFIKCSLSMKDATFANNGDTQLHPAV